MKTDTREKGLSFKKEEGEYQSSKIKSQCFVNPFQFFMARLKNIANN